MAVAAVVAAALAGGAFVGLRPDGDSDSGRLRKRQYAGSAADRGFVGDQLDAPVGSTVPGPDGSVPVEGTTGTGLGTGTSAAAPTTPTDPRTGDGSSTSTETGGSAGASTTSKPGGTTATTRPKAATPATAATAAAGWAPLPKSPIGERTGHTAVWTGKEMVVWGGTRDFETDPSTDGAAYDPAARTWRKVPGAPLTPRFDVRVSWTGQEMLVFGGTSIDGDDLADGALWNPATNTWRSIPASPLGPRNGAVVAWAGDRLVIWSGHTVPGPDASEDVQPELRNDGTAYVPASNRWVPVGAAPIAPRSGAQSVWAGDRLLISGGDDDELTDGAAFEPVAGTWSPIAARPEPGSCGGDIACTGIWTGTVALFPASGLAYDPSANRWSAIAPAPEDFAPVPGDAAVWTGKRLLTWGEPGSDVGDSEDADLSEDSGDALTPPGAAIYDPVANRWERLPAGPLRARTFHTAVWTGEAMLVWGGSDYGEDRVLSDGAAYRPE
jgi:hypothetical protein